MTSTLRVSRRGRIAAPAGLVLIAALAGSLTLAGGLVPAPASAATGHALHGQLQTARQNTTNHKLHVSGFAYDGGAGRRAASVRVSLFVNGHYTRTVTTRGGSGRYDHRHHIKGRHAFSVTLHPRHRATKVRLQAHAAGKRNGRASVGTRRVHEYTPAAERIVHVARRYLGSRYSYGAEGPHAFDCSGYSRFVYRKARVAHLPHNSQAQRHAKHMRRIARSQARPGDLVFYLSGDRAYHVSIYAGHDKQYSATDPSRGVEHSKISSRHVIFKTDWH